MKVVYFYWSGNKMSFFNYLSVYSFKKMNPDWVIHLYTSNNDVVKPTWSSGEQNNIYDGEDYFIKCSELCDKVIEFDYSTIGLDNNMHPVHKADILRQYLLYEHGGLWSDMDILWIKSIDKLYEETLKNIDVTFVYVREVHCSGVVYTSGNKNAIYETIFNHVKNNYNSSSYQGAGPIALKTLLGDFDSIRDRWPDLKIVNLSQSSFAPYWYNEINNFYGGVDQVADDTIGIHWFGGALESAEQVNTLTESDIYNTNKNSVLLNYIREVY